MQDDFTVFWCNNDRARTLFYDLLARSERGAYDDDFLAQLAAYREAAPDSERADIFAAQYLLHHGDAENAVLCGERAFQKRPLNLEVWRVLAAAYKQLGRELDAVTMQGYAYGLYRGADTGGNRPRSQSDRGNSKRSLGPTDARHGKEPERPDLNQPRLSDEPGARVPL